MPSSIADHQGASWHTHPTFNELSRLLSGEGVWGLTFKPRVCGEGGLMTSNICGGDALISPPLLRPAQLHIMSALYL